MSDEPRHDDADDEREVSTPKAGPGPIPGPGGEASAPGVRSGEGWDEVEVRDDAPLGESDPAAATLVDAAAIEGPADGEPEADDDGQRRPWEEGPDEDAPLGSWLALDDDELLHRVETLGAEDDADDRLLDVVESDRHFFIRQEAAKRVRDRTRLFAFEDDRHIGQILVRHLTRREDLTYLERLAIRCRHAEVRSAAQVQLARVWRWLESSRTPHAGTASWAAVAGAETSQSGRMAGPPAENVPTTEPLARDGVDASLLGWAAHFIVEQAWTHLGTTATRELLRRTHRRLAEERESLNLFTVSEDARVSSSVAPGTRIPREAVQDVATWMTLFREAARAVAPEILATSVRGCTSLMADALREAGFYAACDDAEVFRTS